MGRSYLCAECILQLQPTELSINKLIFVKGIGNRKHRLQMHVCQENQQGWILSFDIPKDCPHDLLYWPLRSESFLYQRFSVSSQWNIYSIQTCGKPMFSQLGNFFFNIRTFFSICIIHCAVNFNMDFIQSLTTDLFSNLECTVWFAIIPNSLKTNIWGD